MYVREYSRKVTTRYRYKGHEAPQLGVCYNIISQRLVGCLPYRIPSSSPATPQQCSVRQKVETLEARRWFANLLRTKEEFEDGFGLTNVNILRWCSVQHVPDQTLMWMASLMFSLANNVRQRRLLHTKKIWKDLLCLWEEFPHVPATRYLLPLILCFLIILLHSVHYMIFCTYFDI